MEIKKSCTLNKIEIIDAIRLYLRGQGFPAGYIRIACETDSETGKQYFSAEAYKDAECKNGGVYKDDKKRGNQRLV